MQQCAFIWNLIFFRRTDVFCSDDVITVTSLTCL